MKRRILLETLTDVLNFSKICEQLNDSNIVITDETGNFIVSAKSILGSISIINWNRKIYVQADKNYFTNLKDFIIDL